MKEINEKVKEIKDKLNAYEVNLDYLNIISHKDDLESEDLKYIERCMKENKDLLIEIVSDNFKELNELNMKFIKNCIGKIKQHIDVKQ